MKYKLGDITINHWNDWDRVPRDPTTVGAAILNALNLGAYASTSAVFGLTTVAGVVGYIAVTAVTSWALKALAPKQDFGTQGLLVNSREATAPQQIVYGEVRKGGVITFAETTTGDDGYRNRYLHQIICLAGHEVQEIGDIYLNDKIVALDADGFVDDADWKDDDGLSRVQILKFTGADDQNIYSTITGASSPIASDERPSWQVDGSDPTNNEDSNFKGEGIACLYVKFNYNKNIFADGIPLITAKVKGKKVYDPRTSTTAYSANAALCIRDYLTSTYGLDNDGDTDDATGLSFDVAADACDEDVNLAATDAGSFIVGKSYTIKTVGTTDFTAIGASANTVGVTFTATDVGSGTGTAVRGTSLTEGRYEINGVVSLNRTPSDILSDMMTACAGTLFWGAGKWHLKVGDYISPVKTFTLDDLRSEINLQTKHPRRDNFNIVRGTFIDADNRYIQADYPEIRSETFISDDSGVESALDLTLPFTTSSAMAQRLAKMTLFRAREQITFTADFGLEAFEVECGDIIALTIDRYGWSAKEFEVVGWKFKNDGDAGDLRVALTLRETSSAAFSWSAEETDITSNNSTLPDPRAGLTVSNLSVAQDTSIASDGTHMVTATVSWDDVDSAYLSHYEVEYRETSGTDYFKSIATDNSFQTGLLIDGTGYTVRVRAVTDAGYKGDHATATFTGQADTTAPSAPTSLSVQAGYRSLVLEWTNPTDNDFKEVDVYVNTTNNSSTATKLGSTAGTSFTHAGLSQNVTRYYWVKAKDFTGNASAFSTGANGTVLADPSSGVQGATGDTVISGRVYYQVLQSGQPNAPTATSYSVSTASFTGLTTDWALTQPQVDITDTSIKEWSSAFTVTIDGSDSTQTIVFTTPTGAVQVADNIESDNYNGGGDAQNQGTQGWHINRDTGYAEFGSAAIRGTLTVGQVPDLTASKITDLGGLATQDTVDYDTDISNTPDLSTYATTAQLGTKNTVFAQPSTNTPTALEDGDLWYQTDTLEYYRWNDSSSVWAEVTLTADSIVAGTIDAGVVTVNNLDATKITAGVLEADHIKLTGSQLQNSGGVLVISSGGVDTTELADNAVDTSKIATTLQSTNYVAGTSGWQINKSGTVEFQDATIRGTLNATDIEAGTLSAAHINLTSSQLENSGGALVISSSGVDTAELADDAVDTSKIAATLQSTNYVSGTSGWQINKSGTVEFQDATIRGSLNATDIDAGTLSVDRMAGLTRVATTTATSDPVSVSLSGVSAGSTVVAFLTFSGQADSGGSYSWSIANSMTGATSQTLNASVVSNGYVTLSGSLINTSASAGTVTATMNRSTSGLRTGFTQQIILMEFIK